MRKLLRDLIYHYRLAYTMKAMAFASAPVRVRRTLPVLHMLYLATVLAVMGDAIVGNPGLITGAMLGGIVGYWYSRLLSLDGREAMEQVEAFITDEQAPLHHQYPDYVEEVEDGQDPPRV